MNWRTRCTKYSPTCPLVFTSWMTYRTVLTTGRDENTSCPVGTECTISLWEVCPIIAHSQNGGFITFDISGSRCIVTISIWEVCPIIAHSQNGGFVTFYISGSRCIVNISVWEVCPIIAHSQNGGFVTF